MSNFTLLIHIHSLLNRCIINLWFCHLVFYIPNYEYSMESLPFSDKFNDWYMSIHCAHYCEIISCHFFMNYWWKQIETVVVGRIPDVDLSKALCFPVIQMGRWSGWNDVLLVPLSQCESLGENPDCLVYSPVVFPLHEYILILLYISAKWS